MQALELMHDKLLQGTLGSNCNKMAYSGSATKIVDEIFNLVDKR